MRSAYLITGASGFLGKELYRVLSVDGRADTLSRSAGSGIQCDLSLATPLIEAKYDVVVHNAGKAHVVPKTAKEAEDFFRVNYHGTLNLLKGIEQSGNLPKAFLLISTVAVYGLEQGDLLDEETPLNASSPYGLSKKMAEEAVLKWGEEHRVTIGILRLPLVAGEHPPGNLNKMLKAQRAGYYFQIDGGKARKSMVAAVDVAEVIPKLAVTGGIFNLTDQYHPSFVELAGLFSKKLKVKPPHNMPMVLAQLLATVGDIVGRLFKKDARFNSNTLSKMTKPLTFSDAKAEKLLAWQPTSVLEVFENLSDEELIYD